MLVDARSLPDGSVIQSDICIIGAGPAGLTIAKRLAGKGARIVVLESGGRHFEPETDALTEGEYTGIEIEPLDVTHMRALGGTSIVWEGHCRPFDGHELENRPWMPDSGWPFGRAELDPYYAIAHEILRLGPVDYDIRTIAAETGLPVLPFDEDDVFHRVGRIRHTNLWLDYAVDLETADDVAVHTHATVLTIHATSDGGSVDRLSLGTLEGKRLTARAGAYVLACGGIDNARLLLLSNDVHPDGLGNRNDLVGRYFMEHSHFVAGTLLLSGEGLPERGLYYGHGLDGGVSVKADLGLSPAVQEREQIGNALGRLRPTGRRGTSEGLLAGRSIYRDLREGRFPDDLADNLWAALMDIDEVAVRAYEKLFDPTGELTDTFEIESYIEQTPNPESRVTLSQERDAFDQPKAHLTWKLTDFDKRTALRSVELFAQAVGAQDIGRIRIDVGPEDVFPPDTGWGHHHIGTTRMSDDPKRGVVDRNGKVHDVSNLYVAGSSIFPTAGCATPTLTVVALAARLADHLAGSLQGTTQ